MAAASALMLTACTSESDVLQSATKQEAPKAVGFDVYTQNATNVTRAGLEGTMTTSRLQRSEYEGGGFGVYAFQVQDQVATVGYEDNASSYLSNKNINPSADAISWRTTPQAPNFMVNEKLLWNSTNQGWYYSPLKYWPNETDNDSQNSNAEMLGDGTNKHIDRLTFFAYAPYVSEGNTSNPGITQVTAKDGKLWTKADGTGTAHTVTSVLEPSIAYKAATSDPNQAVDLLWGVAPAGGLTYTAVNGKTVNIEEGEPLMDMTKPDVNTNMKFLFQHALARIGVTAVAAIDQVGAGGTLDPNTKITIQKITLKGYFGETGILNLDNEKANVANWRYISGVNLSDKASDATTVALTTLPQTTLTLEADHTAESGVEHHTDAVEFSNHQKGSIARHLQFIDNDGTIPAQSAVSDAPVAQNNRVGVTTVRQNVIMPALIDNASGAGHNRPWYSTRNAITTTNELEYSETTPYYTDKDCSTQATADVYYASGVKTDNSGSHYVFTLNDKGEYTKTSDAVQLKYPQVNNYLVLSFTKVEDGSGAYGKDNAFIKEKQAYTLDGSTYKPKPVGEAPAKDDYVITYNTTTKEDVIAKATALYPSTDAPGTPYYKRDANYFMVVPINNVPNICTSLTDEDELKKLRTVTVQIEYYITTTDSKLNGGLAQTKNVITKDVVFPSIANGKSYNLNLVLGLTSVKMEAEVDDWKVINVQGDLPQNTAE